MKYSQLMAVTALLVVIAACGGKTSGTPIKSTDTNPSSAPAPVAPAPETPVSQAPVGNSGNSGNATVSVAPEPKTDSDTLSRRRALIDEKRMNVEITRQALSEGAEAIRVYESLQNRRGLAMIEMPVGFYTAVGGVAGYGLKVPQAEIRLDDKVKKIDSLVTSSVVEAEAKIKAVNTAIKQRLVSIPNEVVNASLPKETVAKILDLPVEAVQHDFVFKGPGAHLDHAVRVEYLYKQLGVNGISDYTKREQMFAKLRPEVVRSMALDFIVSQKKASAAEVATKLVRDLKSEGKALRRSKLVWGSVILGGIVLAVDGGLTLTLSESSYQELKTQIDRLKSEAQAAVKEFEEESAKLAAEQIKVIESESSK
jgi:hypothetical protein